MISKKFFIFAAFALVCLGASAREVAAAPKPVDSCRTLYKPGSYVLTQNLASAGNCVIVAADDITLDLDGYVIEGPGLGNGLTYGIWDNGVARRNVTVRNGTVRNFIYGINLLASSEITVERIRALDNGDGISVGENSLVKDNIARGNSDGIVAHSGSLLTGNVANNNSYGFKVYCSVNLIGNMAVNNATPVVVNSGVGCTFHNNNYGQ